MNRHEQWECSQHLYNSPAAQHPISNTTQLRPITAAVKPNISMVKFEKRSLLFSTFLNQLLLGNISRRTFNVIILVLAKLAGSAADQLPFQIILMKHLITTSEA